MSERFDQIGLGVAIGALKEEFSRLGLSVVGDRLADALELAGRRTAQLENDRDAALAERDEARKRFNDIDMCKMGQAPCDWALTLIAERDAAFALGVEAAAKAGGDAAVARAERLDPDLMPLRRQMIRQGVANPIRNAATVTPLQAALALPEVRELVGALKKRDVVRACTTTGGPNHEGQRWVHWADYQELRQRIDNALAKLEAKG